MARSCSKIAPLTTVILAITPPQMGATIQMRNFIYFPKSNWTMLSWYWCIYFFNLDYLKNEQPTPITICPFWLKSINMYFYLPCDHYFCSVILVGHLNYEPMQACCRWQVPSVSPLELTAFHYFNEQTSDGCNSLQRIYWCNFACCYDDYFMWWRPALSVVELQFSILFKPVTLLHYNFVTKLLLFSTC